MGAAASLHKAQEKLSDYLSKIFESYFSLVRDSLAFMPDSATSSNSICFCFTTENNDRPCANLRLFGKILHAQSNEAARAKLLEDLGYPIDIPLLSNIENDTSEIVIHRYVDETSPPMLHALALEIEAGGCIDRNFSEVVYEYDQLQSRIGGIITNSLRSGDVYGSSQEKFHELFYMRLVDEQGDRVFGSRVKSFYLGKNVILPDGCVLPFGSGKQDEEALWDFEWHINGRVYPITLREILERAKDVLNPKKIAPVYVTAHGDDHIGNMRYDFMAKEGGKITCFDPEFAGTQIPALMAMTKSLCNSALAHPHIFLHPEKYVGELDVDRAGSAIRIRFDDRLTPLRACFLQSQKQHVWVPLIRTMNDRGILPENWEEVSRLALSCCLLLVRNLISEDRIRYQTAMVSLATAVMFSCAPLNGKDAVSNFFDHINEKIKPLSHP